MFHLRPAVLGVLLSLIALGLALPSNAADPGDAAQATDGIAPPAPLDERGMANLEAFTRLLGLVRFYHPSDQAAVADWDQVAMVGVQETEGADDAEELAAALERVFRPLAPTLRVVATGAPEPELPGALTTAPEGSSRVAWRHIGVRLGETSNVYQSSRESPDTRPDGRRALPATSVVRRDLPGGVTVFVPRVLYTDSDGATVPAPSDGATLPASSKPEGFEPTGDDRTTRLAAVALAWPVFQHFYPYFDVVDVDWDAVLPATLERAATAPSASEFSGTLRWMLAHLQDGHGGTARTGGVTPGSLPLTWDWIEDRLVITTVDDDAPDGLAPGDVVTEIDGEPAERVVERAMETSPAATQAARRNRAVRELVVRSGFGEPVETVRLTVVGGDGGDGGDGEARQVIARRTPSGPGRFAPDEPRPEPVAELEPGILYIDLTRLEEEAEQTAALERLGDARAVIFDVRGYPTISIAALPYLATEPITSAQWNIPENHLPDQEATTYRTSSWMPQPPAEPHFGGPVVFLTDERAISYAESYMGIVEHYELGEIVGAPTAGTNGNINPFDLPGGYRVWWTGMKVLKHDGSRHHGVGIQPTIPAERTIEGVRAGRDEVLERGLEVVREKLGEG